MSFAAALQARTLPLPPPPRLLARYRGVSFHEERFSWLRHEGEALFAQHYREASADLTVPLDPNWAQYEGLEQAGLEVCVVARRKGTPIGYANYAVSPNMHYDYTVAECDVFFLEPEHRTGWLGVKLLSVAEALLKEKGVAEMHARVKLHVQPGRGGRDLGVLFRYLGYRPIEVNYRKRIA
jgi:GNAT superfamily N-acetyltransferase